MRRRHRRRNYPAAVARSGEPQLRRLPELVKLPRRSPLYVELAQALAAADAFHLLRSNLEPVPVRPTSTTSQAGCYRMRKGDPIDLRVSRRHGRIALSFLHELGHLVDHQLGYEESDGTFASARHEAFADWRDAAAALPSRLPPGTGRSQRRYFQSAKEVWARSYAQTAIVRSGHQRLVEHVATLQEAGDIFVWPAAEFEPVAVEVERVLGRLGLLRSRVAVAA
jgi:hypothetical protein